MKFNLKCILEKRKKKGKLITENVPIFIVATFGGKRLNLFSGFRINLEDWNEKDRMVKRGAINSFGQKALEINNGIDELTFELRKYFREKIEKGEQFTKDDVKLEFRKLREDLNPENLIANTSVRQKEQDSLFTYFDRFIDERGKEKGWVEGTVKKYKSLKNHLKNFDEDLQFSDINEDFMRRFLDYLILDLGWRNATVRRGLTNLRTFLRYLFKKRLIEVDEFTDFRPNLKTVERKVIFLDEDEIQKISDFKIPENKNYLNRVRDVLLFQCFSGLRYSDVKKLKRQDVRKGKVFVLTRKTVDSLEIELNNRSEAILNKYKDDQSLGERALPVISNQKMNEYLKELGEMVGIDEPVTIYYFHNNQLKGETKPKYEEMSSHIGRRSFICLCISKDVAIPVIMEWTGHKDYDSMRPYIDATSKTKAEQMKKLNF